MRAAVRAVYGLDLVELIPVVGGADHRSVTWRGTASTGAAYAIRLSRSSPAASVAVLGELAHAGVPGVPVLLVPQTAEAAAGPVEVLAPWHLTVQTWVAGRADVAAPLTRAQWQSLGAVLRAVHDLDPESVRSVLPVEQLDTGWHDNLLDRVERGLARATSESGAALREVWTVARPRIERVQETMHRLRVDLTARPGRGLPRMVICHTDPHLGNVVIGPDGGVTVIDWADAAVAPVERDLMFVFGGVIAAAPVGPVERTSFFAGYGPVVIDPDLIAWYRCLRVIEDLGLPAMEILTALSPTEPSGELEIIQGVLSPTGLLAQALSAVGTPSR